MAPERAGEPATTGGTSAPLEAAPCDAAAADSHPPGTDRVWGGAEAPSALADGFGAGADALTPATRWENPG